MAIHEKDLKILWAKAAGRCSMPDCRRKLIEATEDLASRHDVQGFSCHIVAEKPDGPRGDSRLTLEERNRYPNLIVLCKTHHEMVDQSPADWSVEKIHQIKADHELWVETCLTEADSTDAAIFSDLIMAATNGLHLEHWRYISDHAIRSLVPQSFVDGINDFTEKVFRTIWPSCFPELRATIEDLANRAQAFTGQYMELATIRNDDFYAEDRSWKSFKLSQQEYSEFDDRSRQWQRKCTSLLMNLIHSLNLYADAVRRYLNPHYFIYEGKFALYDDMGVTNHMEPMMYIPDRFVDD